MRRFAIAFFLSILLLPPALAPAPVLALTSNDPEPAQWAYTSAGVYGAWDYTTGNRDVVVAVIDNGFDTFHPDLKENVWKNEDEVPENGIDDDRNGYVDDVWGWNWVRQDINGDGVIDAREERGNSNPQPSVFNLSDKEREDGVFNHGTIVAGLIGAVGNNNRDGAGINWAVRLMNLKIIDNSGEGPVRPVADAVRYAVDNGASVINISMVGDYDERALEAVKYAQEKGVVVVAAAGNNYQNLDLNPLYPICFDNDGRGRLLLGVSAIGRDHKLAPFSNTGATCIDLTAPGRQVASTIRYAPEFNFSRSYSADWYDKPWSGTSFAAPFVSGAAALIKSLQPSWKASEIYDAIIKNVHRTPPQDPDAYQKLYGAGRIQIDKAVAYAASLLNSNQTIENTVTSTIISTEVAPAPSTSSLSVPLSATLPAIPPVSPPAITAPTLPLPRLLAVDLATGLAEDYKLGEEESATYERSVARGAGDIAFGVGPQGKPLYVLARAGKKKTESRIFVYNNKWQEESSWTVPLPLPLSLAVGDTTGDDMPEVAVAPADRNREVFRLYDLSGRKLAASALKQPHKGVSVTIADGRVVAVYTIGKKTKVYSYRENKLVSSFTVDGLGVRPSLAAAQLDRDKELELVLGSSAGAAPSVSYYDVDGENIISYQPFERPRSIGLRVRALAVPDTGRDLVVIYPETGVADVSVRNHRGRELHSWEFFAGTSLKNWTVVLR